MKDKLSSYLGFAAKARKVVTGYNTCIFMMEKKKIKLIVLTEDLGENSRKKMVSKAESLKVPYRIFGKIDELSHITGNEGKGIFGLTDENFAKVISEEIDNIQSLDKEVF